MKELTALDINYLVKELRQLENAKVDQVYQPADLLIRFHSSQFGKKILRINRKFVFLTQFKEDQSSPSDFCMILRKFLKNTRLKSINQHDFERIIRLVFETKEGELFLYVELFSKSNIILTNKENVIIASLFYEKAKRTVKKGEIYEVPKKEINFLTLTENKLKVILKSSELTLVKTLATKLGLGGIYAEYVLENFDKGIKANEFKDAKNLFSKLKELTNKPIQPSKIKNHLVPFKTENLLDVKTYNEALEKFLTTQLRDEQSNISIQPFLNKKAKLDKIIQTQKDAIKNLESEIEKSTKKGELIYNNYSLIENVIKQLKEAKKVLSWEEIKSKLKKQKTLKKIDLTSGKVLIDLK